MGDFSFCSTDWAFAVFIMDVRVKIKGVHTRKSMDYMVMLDTFKAYGNVDITHF